MPIVLLVIGSFLLVSGARGKQDDLFGLVKGDFSGPNNFLYWFLAIAIIGSIGYIKPLEPISKGFIWLLVVVLFLVNGGGASGFFAKLSGSVSATSAANTFKVNGVSVPITNTAN